MGGGGGSFLSVALCMRAVKQIIATQYSPFMTAKRTQLPVP